MVKLLVVGLVYLALTEAAPSPGSYGARIHAGPVLFGIGLGSTDGGYHGGHNGQYSGSSGYHSGREYQEQNSQQFDIPYQKTHSGGYGGDYNVKTGSAKGHSTLGYIASLTPVEVYRPSGHYHSHGGYSSYADTADHKNKWGSEADIGFHKTSSLKYPVKGGHIDANIQIGGGGYSTGLNWGGQESGTWGDKTKADIGVVGANVGQLSASSVTASSNGYNSGFESKEVKSNNGDWNIKNTGFTTTDTVKTNLGGNYDKKIDATLTSNLDFSSSHELHTGSAATSDKNIKTQAGYKTGYELKTGEEKSDVRAVTTDSGKKFESALSVSAVAPISSDSLATSVVSGISETEKQSGYKTGQDLKTNKQETGVWGTIKKEVTNTGALTSVGNYDKKLESTIIGSITFPDAKEYSTGFVGTQDDIHKTGYEKDETKSGIWSDITKEVIKTGTTKVGGDYGTTVTGSVVAPVSKEHSTVSVVSGNAATEIKSGYDTVHKFETGEEKSGVWSVATKEQIKTDTTKLGGNYGETSETILPGKIVTPISKEYSTVSVVSDNKETGTKNGNQAKHEFETGAEKSEVWSETTKEVTKSGTTKVGGDYGHKAETTLTGSVVVPISKEHATKSAVSESTNSGSQNGHRHELQADSEKGGIWSITTKKEIETGTIKVGGDYGKKPETTLVGSVVAHNTKEHETVTVASGNSNTGTQNGYKTGHEFETGTEHSGAWSVKTKEVTKTGTAKVGGDYGKKSETILVDSVVTPISKEHSTVSIVSGITEHGTQSGSKAEHEFKTDAEKSGVWSVTTKEINKTGTAKVGGDYGKKPETAFIDSFVAPDTKEHAIVSVVSENSNTEAQNGYKTGHEFQTDSEKGGVWSITTKEEIKTGTTKIGGDYGKKPETTLVGSVVAHNTKEHESVTVASGNSNTGTQNGYKTGHEFETGTKHSGAWSVKTKEVTKTGTAKVGGGYGKKSETTLVDSVVTPVSKEHSTVSIVSGITEHGTQSGSKTGHEFETGAEKSGVWSITTKEESKTGTTNVGGDYNSKPETVLTDTVVAPISKEHSTVTVVSGDKQPEEFTTGAEKGGAWSVSTKKVTKTEITKVGSDYGKKPENTFVGNVVAPISKEHSTVSFVSGNTEIGTQNGYKNGHEFETGAEKSGIWSITTKEETKTGTTNVGGDYSKTPETTLVSSFVAPVSKEHSTVSLVSGNTEIGSQSGYKTEHEFETGAEKSGVWSITTKEETKTGTTNVGGDYNRKPETVLTQTIVAPISKEHSTVSVVSGHKQPEEFTTGAEKGDAWSVSTKQVTKTETTKVGSDYGKKPENSLVGNVVAPISKEHSTVSLVSGNTEIGTQNGYKTGQEFETGPEKSVVWSVITKEETKTGTTNVGGDYSKTPETTLVGSFVAPVSKEHSTVSLVSGNTEIGTQSGYKTGHEFETGAEKSGVWSITTKEETKTGTTNVGGDYNWKPEIVLTDTVVAPISKKHSTVSVVSGGKQPEEFTTGAEKSGAWSVSTKKVTKTETTKVGSDYGKKPENILVGSVVAPISKEHSTVSLVSGNTEIGTQNGHKTGHEFETGAEKDGVWLVTTKEVTKTGTTNLGGDYGRKPETILTGTVVAPIPKEHSTVSVVSGNTEGEKFKTGAERSGVWKVTTKTVTKTGISNLGGGFGKEPETTLLGSVNVPSSKEHSSVSVVNGKTGIGTQSGYEAGHEFKTGSQNDGVWSVTTKEVTKTGTNNVGGYGRKPEIALTGIAVAPISKEHSTVSVISGNTETGPNFKTGEEKSGVWTVTTKEVAHSGGPSSLWGNLDQKFKTGFGGEYQAALNGGLNSGNEFNYKIVSNSGLPKVGSQQNGFWTVKTKEISSSSGDTFGDKSFGGLTKGVLFGNPEKQSIVLQDSDVAKSGFGNLDITGTNLKNSEKNSGTWTITTKEVTQNSAPGKYESEFISGVVPIGSVYETNHDLNSLKGKNGAWTITTKAITSSNAASNLGNSYGTGHQDHNTYVTGEVGQNQSKYVSTIPLKVSVTSGLGRNQGGYTNGYHNSFSSSSHGGYGSHSGIFDSILKK